MAMKRIVVGVDGSDASRAALWWAADEAHRRRAYVLAVLVADDEPAQGLAEIVDDVLGRIPSVEVERRTMRGDAAPSLIEASRDAQLLVVGADERDGSVAHECAQHAFCPVVVVQPPERAQRQIAGARSA